jgi:hypothetical protein
MNSEYPIPALTEPDGQQRRPLSMCRSSLTQSGASALGVGAISANPWSLAKRSTSHRGVST